MKTRAQIECPFCSERANLGLENIVCRKCYRSLSGDVYKKQKKSIVAVAITGSSVAMSALYIGFDNYLDKQYPIGYEYEIVSACVDSDNTPLDLGEYKEKQKLCICAYGKVTKKLDYKETEKPEYKDEFKKSLNECSVESQNQATPLK